jgi:membrane protease YdiL (CAAX protease family)
MPRKLILFFVLAFIITWLSQLIAVLLLSNSGITFSNERNFLLFIELFSGKLEIRVAMALLIVSFAMGPAVAALVTTYVTEGGSGIKPLFNKTIKYKVNLKWYLVVFAVPVLLNMASFFIGLIPTGFTIPEYKPLLPPVYFLPFFFYLVIFTGFSEEIGWRGYALEKLQEKYTAYRSSWILGVLWGAWHIPFMLYLNTVNNIPLAGSIIMIIGLLLGTVGWTIVNTWIYNNTKSVFIIAILHGWGNAIQSFWLLSFPIPLAQLVFGFLPWVLAWWLLKKYGEKDLLIKN